MPSDEEVKAVVEEMRELAKTGMAKLFNRWADRLSPPEKRLWVLKRLPAISVIAERKGEERWAAKRPSPEHLEYAPIEKVREAITEAMAAMYPIWRGQTQDWAPLRNCERILEAALKEIE